MKLNQKELETAEEFIKRTRKPLKLSDLYAKLIDGEESLSDRMLIMQVLKTIALSQVRTDSLVFSETHYIDLEVKEKPENF